MYFFIVLDYIPIHSKNLLFPWNSVYRSDQETMGWQLFLARAQAVRLLKAPKENINLNCIQDKILINRSHAFYKSSEISVWHFGRRTFGKASLILILTSGQLIVPINN